MKLTSSFSLILLLTGVIVVAEDPPRAPPKEPAPMPADGVPIKDPSTVKREKTYSALEIFKQIRAKNLPKKELVKLLGEPDYKCKYNGQELWQYYNLTQDDKDPTKLWHQYFMFENEKVSYDWVTKDAGPPRKP